MKKVIKKIATVVASISMVAAMSVAAFADDSAYSFVGNPNLFNEADQGNNKVGWIPTMEDYVMTPVDGQEGLYEFTSTYVLASEDTEETKNNATQFKILKDAEDNAWSYQAAIGMPDAVWADNQTQFKIVDETFEPGEFKVYVRPADGYVAVLQNKKVMELNVRYHSRDEDPADFVALSRDNILAVDSIEKPGEKAYPADSVKFDDAAYLTFLNDVLALEGGEAIDALPGIEGAVTAADDTKSDDAAVTADDTKADDTAVTADDTKADDAKAETTKKAEEKESKSNSTVIIIVVVVVVVVIALLAVVLGKKKDN